MDDQTLERLETRIAFLERANSELSDVVFRQQQEIQALATKLREVLERLSAEREEAAGGPEQERPPHY
jgi:SlyX protein